MRTRRSRRSSLPLLRLPPSSPLVLSRSSSPLPFHRRVFLSDSCFHSLSLSLSLFRFLSCTLALSSRDAGDGRSACKDTWEETGDAASKHLAVALRPLAADQMADREIGSSVDKRRQQDDGPSISQDGRWKKLLCSLDSRHSSPSTPAAEGMQARADGSSCSLGPPSSPLILTHNNTSSRCGCTETSQSPSPSVHPPILVASPHRRSLFR